MSVHPIRHNQPVHDSLHPHVYRTMVALSIWFVLSVWLLFNRGPYNGLTFAIVTVFFLIAVALPAILARTWRRNVPPDECGTAKGRFREWAALRIRHFFGRGERRRGGNANPVANRRGRDRHYNLRSSVLHRDAE